MDIEICISEGFLQRIKPNKEIQNKELSASEYDLKQAQTSFENQDHKWTIIQAYYAIFHSARALLNKLGYREKRHFAIGIVLEDLVKNGKINTRLVSDFHAAMSAREDADYRDVYSGETAEYILDITEDFINEIKKLMKRV